jgi:hypothetical protein
VDVEYVKSLWLLGQQQWKSDGSPAMTHADGLSREAAFRSDGYRCRQCGLQGSPRNPLQADHLTYENYNRIGRAPVGDLQTLCLIAIKSPLAGVSPTAD